MKSRIKSIISSGTLVNSMYEPNSVNCEVSNGKVWEYKADFASRHPERNFGEKLAMPTYDVKDYTDEEILSLPPR